MPPRNEGEGNKTAAREYNKRATEFAKSGRAWRLVGMQAMDLRIELASR